MMENGYLVLDNIKFAVLDEADEMLNMGFADDTEKILKAITSPHQTLLWSATIPDWVKQMAQKYMHPEFVTIDLVSEETLQTSKDVVHYALCCHFSVRAETLADVIKVYGQNGRAIVFANTKSEASELGLSSSISNDCQVLHGDINQNQREITLAGFRENKFHVLVATDVAARGLDIPDVDLVVQCEPPGDVETYIHRSGRTGRAGKKGSCITFFTPAQTYLLKLIEKRAGISFIRIGTPQYEDLIRVASAHVLERINKVSEEMIPHFLPSASALLQNEKEFTKESVAKTLARAFALISGYTQPFAGRSLLCSLADFTTIRVKGPRPIFSPRFVLNFLSDICDASQVKTIRLCLDGSAVADVPSKVATQLIEVMKGRTRSTYSVDIPSSLPELQEEPEKDRRNFRGRNDRRNGQQFGRNSDKFSRDGFSNGRGNRKEQGNFRGRNDSNQRTRFGGKDGFAGKRKWN
jgi:ATP-dependent RNA helicase DDX21